MTIARDKSRVRFSGRVKRDRKNRKHFPENSKPKKTNNDTHGPTKAPKGRDLCFGRYYHQTNPLTGSVYMFPVEIDNRIYDDSNSVDDDMASFLKKRVLTTDDQESDGAFKSGLRTALILCRISLVTENPDIAGGDADEYDHEPSGASNDGHLAEPKDSCVPSVSVILDASESVTDENDEPPSSLLMQAPLWAWPAVVSGRLYSCSTSDYNRFIFRGEMRYIRFITSNDRHNGRSISSQGQDNNRSIAKDRR
jgi:hypothetical protein